MMGLPEVFGGASVGALVLILLFLLSSFERIVFAVLPVFDQVVSKLLGLD